MPFSILLKMIFFNTGIEVFQYRILRGCAKNAFGGFGGFDAWQTAGLNANKKLLIDSWALCLRGWGCLCLQGWRCQKGVWRVWRV